MDRRELEVDSPDKKFMKDDKENYFIPLDQIMQEKTFKEALIYNIVMKHKTSEELNYVFREKQLQNDKVPKYFRGYVHSPGNIALVLTQSHYLLSRPASLRCRASGIKI